MAEEQQSSSLPFTIPFPRFNKLSREMNYKFRENECIRIAFIHPSPSSTPPPCRSREFLASVPDAGTFN